jgi:DNA repair protein RecO (recombination protein O)
LEQAAFPANLHLKILVDLTRLYGIQPQEDPLHVSNYLDLETGQFTSVRPGHGFYADAEQTRLFRALGGMNFAEAQALSLSRASRNEMLNRLIEYYQIRYPGLNKLNSRDVFESIFDA